MGFAGKISVSKYDEFSELKIRLFTIELQLALYALYCYIIIIRLLQTMVGNEIFR